jgi:hypothetical protein
MKNKFFSCFLLNNLKIIYNIICECSGGQIFIGYGKKSMTNLECVSIFAGEKTEIVSVLFLFFNYIKINV